jgi:5-methylcytosine-specific restriction enzyme subunit McrC
VRRGLPRRYCAREEDLPALRGRLDMVRQFSTLAGNPTRLACRYDEMSRDILLNQAMKAAVTLLLKVSHSAANRRLLAQLAFDYADITSVPPRSIRWKEIGLDRTQERWRELVELARLLLGGRYQTTSSGGSPGFSLLFEMNVLFEAYVARLLAAAFSRSDLRIVSQGGRLYCLADEAGIPRFQTRPDILVKRGNNVVLIVDTKWKRIAARIDDAKQGVSQADVYQLMAYGRVYRCRELMLLYPHHRGLAESGVTGVHDVTNCNDRLATATLDLAYEAARTRAELAALVLGRIVPGGVEG